MAALDLYGIGALALIGLVFYCVRHVRAYLALGAAIVGGFAFGFAGSSTESLATRGVMTTGLAACVFGLLIVRMMLIRSVSLQLLSRIDGARSDVFDENIRGRLDDMRTFQLVHPIEGAHTLTAFGRLVSGIVAVSYTLFRIRA